MERRLYTDDEGAAIADLEDAKRWEEFDAAIRNLVRSPVPDEDPAE